MVSKEWKNFTSLTPLMDDQINVYLCRIWKDDYILNELKHLLSPDEVEKINRFVFFKDKSTYLVSRGVIRYLLGKYLSISPEKIKFSYNEYGKPYVLFPDKHNIYLNLSHSSEYFLFGVNNGSEIGIDIEWINDKISPDEIAGNYFSDSELTQLNLVNEENKLTAFFKIWTRKEAFIKAVSRGLSISLRSFDVTLDDIYPKIKIKDELNLSGKYNLYNLNISKDYCAALCNSGESKFLNLHVIKEFSQFKEFM